MSDYEKKEAVRETISAWSYHAGRFEAEAMGTLFLDNCEFHGIKELVGGKGPLVGPRQIVELLAATFVNFNWLTQMNNIVSITLDAAGTTATTRTNLVERAGPKGRNTTFILIAVYDDVLKLTDQRWRFLRRSITSHDVREVPRQQ
jgi:SnoaL-like domain